MVSPTRHAARNSTSFSAAEFAPSAARELDLDIVESVIRRNLDDLLEFAQTIRVQLDSKPGT
jgi:hypothetical protein